MQLTSLLVAALAGTATAHIPALAKRTHIAAALQARQTDFAGFDGSTECLTAIMSIYSSAPTPPPELESFESASPQTDPCNFTPPTNLGPAWSSYSSEAVSWFMAHSSELYSALSKCPLLSGGFTDGPDICTEAPGPATTNGPATTGAETTEGSSPQSTSAGVQGSRTSSSTAGAARETGLVAAAIAAAGFIGAVAAL